MTIRAVGQRLVTACMVLAVASCATADREATSDSAGLLVGTGLPVPAAGETQWVATQRADAADDAEIWVDPADPSRGVILGTDKQAGLYTYDLGGKILGFIPDGRLNNVDLRADFPTPAGPRVLVAASDRDRKGAALYLLDPATLEVTPWTVVGLDLAEPYGICMGRRGGAFIVLVNSTDGQVRQFSVAADSGGRATTTMEGRFSIPSQPEGCVVDDDAGVVYIGEEDKGIWRYDIDRQVPARGVLVAPAPSEALKPDVEGLALMREGAVRWLIASSQGDSAFAVWRVDGASPEYRGRFSVVAANGVDAVTGTDGVAAIGGPVGRFGEGLIVVQDDVDSDQETASSEHVRQNFKLVDWRDVKRVLHLDAPGSGNAR